MRRGRRHRATWAELRRQALGWLRAELVAWSRMFDSGTPEERVQVIKVLQWWVRDVDLANVRGDALPKLPDAERSDWQTCWDDYAALIRQVGEPGPR